MRQRLVLNRIALSAGIILSMGMSAQSQAASSIQFNPANPGPCHVVISAIDLVDTAETADRFTALVKLNYYGCGSNKRYFEKAVTERPERMVTMLDEGFLFPWSDPPPVEIISNRDGNTVFTTLQFDKGKILEGGSSADKTYRLAFKPGSMSNDEFVWITELRIEANGGSMIRLRQR